ncbi:MAG: gliding motility-associated C-terminal domain-containing protein [Cytophagaceae bacterium]|jgi:gliding motility-associated-like protein|nr:gliding motility-associated C-terminal domain-containing protein [Cytophagaceae bacterium]
MNVRSKLIFYLSLTCLSCSVFSQISFIENKGQWPAEVKYRADIPGGKFFAGDQLFTYLFYDTEALEHLHHEDHHHEGKFHPDSHKKEMPESIDQIGVHAIRIKPLNAQAKSITPEQVKQEVFHFISGQDTQQWAKNARAYRGLNYLDMYPNIDLKWYESAGSLKYEFVVKPGANPQHIQLLYEGVNHMYIHNGSLIIETSVNTIHELPPYVYQEIDGKTVPIGCKYVLKDNILSFEILDRYNKKHPLIIDPQLIFSTYSGSVADNWGNTATYDDQGNMYSGGTVFSAGFPITVGMDPYNGGSNFYGLDIGIMKFSPDGKNLIYGTYVGGSQADVPYSLIVDKNNQLVIAGTTSSFDFPVSANGYSRFFNGGTSVSPMGGISFINGSDFFICKLNASGFFASGTYLGGSGNDGVQVRTDVLCKNYGDQLRGEVIVDTSGNVYMASSTLSNNFPLSPNGSAYQTLRAGGRDGCVFKLSSDLSTLLWSTYLGGTSEDVLYSIALDSANGVYVCGGSTSSNITISPGAYSSSYAGNIDAYVAHLSPDGSVLQHATFLGNSSYNQGYFVQLDQDQQVYILGQTFGIYPVIGQVYSNANSGQFIHCLDPTLSSTIFSTVIGTVGSQRPNISPTAFLVNDCGNIFLSGWGGALNNTSSNFIGSSTFTMPVTSDAVRNTSDGSDFYIMVLSKNAASLLYATYFGAFAPSDPQDHVDGGTSRFDKKGIIYEAVCAGCRGSDLFPTTPGAYSTFNGSSNCNNASFKFDLTNLEADFDIEISKSCQNTQVTFINKSQGGRSFEWDFGDGSTFLGANPGAHTYSASGNYTIRLIATDLTTCIGKDTAFQSFFLPPILPISITTKDTSLCLGDSVRLLTVFDNSYTYDWKPNTFISATNIHNPLVWPSKNSIYTITVRDTNDCEASRQVRVKVVDVQRGINVETEADCEGRFFGNLQNNTIGVAYNWIFGDGSVLEKGGNLERHEYPRPGTYTAILKAENDGCAFTDSATFTFAPVFFPNLITPNQDKKNDVYEIKGITKNWKLEIYNRWGDRVYQNNSYDNTWDGTSLSDGIYFYLITSPNDTKCKGWVQLLR